MHAFSRGTLALGAAAALTCAAATSAVAAPSPQKVDLRFTPVAGEAPVRCAQAVTGLGTTGTSAQLSDLRFYVSGVKLLRRDGRSVPIRLTRSASQATRGSEAVTLIDLEDAKGACAEDGTPSVNRSVRGTVPRGRYVGVRWTVGVPSALNHSDVPAAPAPLNLAALGWSWQFGRIFSKIEFADPAGTAGTWQAKKFFVHLGSTGCVGNPAAGETPRCQAPNRPSVRLKRFDPRRQQVALDVRSLVAGNDLAVNRADAPGCMSGPRDPECDAVFDAYGIDWHADGTGTGTPGGGQTLFRAIGR